MNPRPCHRNSWTPANRRVWSPAFGSIRFRHHSTAHDGVARRQGITIQGGLLGGYSISKRSEEVDQHGMPSLFKADFLAFTVKSCLIDPKNFRRFSKIGDALKNFAD